MKKYAVIQFGGKQFMIHEGNVFDIERQKTPLKYEVLFYSDDKNKIIGEPTVKEAKVKLSVVEEKRARKIRVGRFKSKSRYRKVNGHRQPMSVIKVEKIEFGAAKVEKKAVEKKPTTTKKASTKKPAAKKAPAKKTTSTKAKKEAKK